MRQINEKSCNIDKNGSGSKKKRVNMMHKSNFDGEKNENDENLIIKNIEKNNGCVFNDESENIENKMK